MTGSVIDNLYPSAGAVGTPVIISGSGFGASQGTNSVNFNNIAATPTSWADRMITVTVPPNAISGPVFLTIDGQATNSLNFIVGPSISGVSPASGGPGTSVSISGSGFGSTQASSSVTFNGVSGSPTSWSDTMISLPVPASATSGSLVVTVGGYTSNAVAFSVAPSISSLLPAGGPVGIPVTVTGLNFGATQGTGTITFNGVTATPTSWGPSRITVPVPAGASSGSVIVTAGGQSSNSVSFTVGTGTIAGTISRTSDQAPIAGATVQALQANTAVASSTSASDGSYSMTNLNPGTYDVRVSSSSYGTALSAGNSVVANQTTQVNVGLGSPGTIAGQVTQQTGQNPISDASVTIFQGSDSVGQANTDGFGMYSVSTLAPGSYAVQASASGYGSQTQTSVQVTAGNSTTTNFSLASQSNITYQYDDAGRLIGVVDSQNGAAKYAYDAVGNILSITRVTQGQVGITGFTPSSGAVGTAVTISGTGFSPTVGQNTVTFNGVAATVTSATTNQLVATVPTGASTGAIAVTAPGGSDTSASSFTVTSGSDTPSITRASPPILGNPGTPVAVTGSGFGATPSDNRLRFGGTFATVSSATGTSLSTSVPAQAKSGPLSLSTPNGSGVSNTLFYVVPNGTTCLASDFSATVSLGGQFAGTIVPNHCALVSFNATSGQKIDLNTSFTADGGLVYLTSPDGTQLNAEQLSNGQDDIADTLPLTGTYMALIVNQNSSSFSISGTIFDNSDKFYTINDNSNSQITISTRYGQTAQVQFAGTNNEHITLQATNITYPQTLLPATKFSSSSGFPVVALNSGDQNESSTDLFSFMMTTTP